MKGHRDSERIDFSVPRRRAIHAQCMEETSRRGILELIFDLAIRKGLTVL